MNNAAKKNLIIIYLLFFFSHSNANAQKLKSIEMDLMNLSAIMHNGVYEQNFRGNVKIHIEIYDHSCFDFIESRLKKLRPDSLKKNYEVRGYFKFKYGKFKSRRLYFTRDLHFVDMHGRVYEKDNEIYKALEKYIPEEYRTNIYLFE